ncbi:MAG: PIG-L deacetylase family protein [Longimicrobiales bacterium]
MAGRTLLAVLAHPDDEVLAAGTLRAQRVRGDRVVVLYLTRGEATAALGDLAPEDVARRRLELAREAAAILDVEHRFLDFPDTGVAATPESARTVARVLAEIAPDALITWGRMWAKGMRHPDHHATGTIAVDAVTLARIARVAAPHAPHRAECPVFTYRGAHSTLPSVVVDVEPHLDEVFALADFYRTNIGFGERTWLESRLRAAGSEFGVAWGERFDAWEAAPGVVDALLPATPRDGPAHPSRPGPVNR